MESSWGASGDERAGSVSDPLAVGVVLALSGQEKTTAVRVKKLAQGHISKNWTSLLWLESGIQISHPVFLPLKYIYSQMHM